MRYRWDIFCRVIDNYGDIGVCWRLARQLRRAHADAVRLWVDDVERLSRLQPDVDSRQPHQVVAGIELYRWGAEPVAVVPGDIAVEAFGCGLPESYVASMVRRTPRPLWITLEYLSAEPWVRAHHGLPSPHPRWPLERYFFFPGFEPGTGGLLREPDLLPRREQYGAAQRETFWRDAGHPMPADDATVVSIFAYPGVPLRDLLSHWERGPGLTIAAIPEGPLAASALDHLGRASPCNEARRGNCEVRVLPFVPQDRYDEVLWCCDCAFVRGEDSFVRAQWAARPLVWNIYPQAEEAHRIKLESFMDLYCAGLPGAMEQDFRHMWRVWNQTPAGPVTVGAAWDRYWRHEAALVAHARRWCGKLSIPGELAENLAQFCRDRLK